MLPRHRFIRAVFASTATVCVFVLSLAGGSARAQTPNWEQQVGAAVQKARNDDYSVLLDLTRKQFKQVLPLLKKYATDPDKNVRKAIAWSLFSVRNEQALEFAAPLVGDESYEVSTVAVEVLYADYAGEELRRVGGKKLRDDLLARTRDGATPPAKTWLLLSCFKGDREAVRALNARRAEFKEKQTFIETYSPNGDAQVVLDIALAELGQTLSVFRTVQHLREGKTQNLILVRDALPFINNQTVLAAVVERLKDKRVALVQAHGAFVSRVCDLMLQALRWKQTNGSRRPRHVVYTDSELAEAYAHFRSAGQP